MDGNIVIGTEIDTKNFDAQIKYIENKMLDIEDKLKQADMGFEVGDVNKLEAEYERLGNQLLNLKKRQDDYNKSLNQTNNLNLLNIDSQLKNVGKSITQITQKVFRWGIAVFGLRSAYMFVRNAINMIAGDDEQLKADIDYIKNAMAYSIEPLVRAIVDLAKQLLQYISYIVYMWTGKKIFENANKNLKSANVQASKLKRTLAGFDEMNILNNNSSSGSSSGGVTAPSFDLANPENIQPPEWLTWIVKHKDEIIATLLGIAGAVEAMKLGIEGIKALGIGIAIGGIVYAIEGLLDYLNDPSWGNFGQIIQGIGIALLGLALIIGSIPTAVAGAVLLIVGTITKYWDDIKSIFQEKIDWLKNKSEEIKNKFGIVGQYIYDKFVYYLQEILNYWDRQFTSAKQILDGLIQFIKGIFSKNWEEAWEGVKKIFKGILTSMLSTVILIFSLIWDKIKNVVEKIKNAFKEVIEFIKGLFGELLDIINNIASKVGDAVNSIKNGISGVKDKVGNFFGGIGNSVRNFFGFQKGGIVVPKLASGGIINQPGRGVPISSAVGGERGMEGVIPLTDSQQMELLGEAIGRYITINANITNTMNGRIISRELQKVQNDSDFAFNR